MIILEKALLIVAVFFLLSFLPNSFGKSKYYGRKYLLSNRDNKNLPLTPEWVSRAERAYLNLQFNLIPFAIIVLVLIEQKKSNLWIEGAAIAFVVARIIHFTSYIGGVVLLRALSYFAGVIATLVLAFEALC